MNLLDESMTAHLCSLSCWTFGKTCWLFYTLANFTGSTAPFGIFCYVSLGRGLCFGLVLRQWRSRHRGLEILRQPRQLCGLEPPFATFCTLQLGLELPFAQGA